MPGGRPDEEAWAMGMISKQDIGRLGQRNFRLEMDCPNCGSTRIRISGGNGSHVADETRCPKCGIHIILDALNVTLVNESAAAQPEPSGAGA